MWKIHSLGLKAGTERQDALWPHLTWVLRIRLQICLGDNKRINWSSQSVQTPLWPGATISSSTIFHPEFWTSWRHIGRMLSTYEKCLQINLVLEALGTGRRVQIINLFCQNLYQGFQGSVLIEPSFCSSAASFHSGAAVVTVILTLGAQHLGRIKDNKKVYHHICI